MAQPLSGNPAQIHKDISQNFLTFFYSNITTNRELVCHVYADNAALTYEGATFQGKEKITEKLQTLPKYKLQISSCDSQFVEDDATRIIILVAGTLVVEEGQPMQFTHNFHLKQFNPTTWLITNEIFRFAFLV